MVFKDENHRFFKLKQHFLKIKTTQTTNQKDMDDNNEQMISAAKESPFAVIFDLDGTLLDTERQYTEFWNKVGRSYFDMANMGEKVKGMTLADISSRYFIGRPDVQYMVEKDLSEFEYFMKYDYIEGAEALLKALHEQQIPMALVSATSDSKLRQVSRHHPKFKDYFAVMLTADAINVPKPAPDGFLQAMEELKSKSESTIIFEDSRLGLQAAKASGAFVVGLATTLPREDVEQMADIVIDNYNDMSIGKLYDFLTKEASLQ